MGLVRRPFGLIDQVNSVGRKPESVAQQGMPAATCEDRNTALRMCIYFSLHHSTNSTMWRYMDVRSMHTAQQSELDSHDNQVEMLN